MRTKMGWRLVVVAFVGLLFAGNLVACDKLKAMMKPAPPKAIKGPKVEIKIIRKSKAVRFVGGQKALIKKALKKVKGYKECNIFWKKKKIVVGHTDDADVQKFVDSLQDFGFKVSLVE